MQDYEICVLRSDGKPSIIMPGVHFSDASAIWEARKIAQGNHFEVWRGIERLQLSHIAKK